MRNTPLHFFHVFKLISCMLQKFSKKKSKKNGQIRHNQKALVKHLQCLACTLLSCVLSILSGDISLKCSFNYFKTFVFLNLTFWFAIESQYVKNITPHSGSGWMPAVQEHNSSVINNHQADIITKHLLWQNNTADRTTAATLTCVYNIKS